VEGLCQGIDQQLVESRFLLPLHTLKFTNLQCRARRMGQNPNDVCRRCQR
jgi:hypothetical protein